MGSSIRKIEPSERRPYPDTASVHLDHQLGDQERVVISSRDKRGQVCPAPGPAPGPAPVQERNLEETGPKILQGARFRITRSPWRRGTRAFLKSTKKSTKPASSKLHQVDRGGTGLGLATHPLKQRLCRGGGGSGLIARGSVRCAAICFTQARGKEWRRKQILQTRRDLSSTRGSSRNALGVLPDGARRSLVTVYAEPSCKLPRGAERHE
jgi:hypothetical protein